MLSVDTLSKIFSIELGLFWQDKLLGKVLVKLSSFFVLCSLHDFNDKFEYFYSGYFRSSLSMIRSDDKNVTKDHFWIRGGGVFDTLNECVNTIEYFDKFSQ